MEIITKALEYFILIQHTFDLQCAFTDPIFRVACSGKTITADIKLKSIHTSFIKIGNFASLNDAEENLVDYVQGYHGTPKSKDVIWVTLN